MNKDQVQASPSVGVLDRVRHGALVTLPLALVGAASAQTTTTGGEAAVQGLGFNTMIDYVGDGARQLITDNGPLMVVAILPLMAFFFIWGRIRSLF